MKKFGIVALLLILSSPAWSQALDSVVAKITLYKTTTISQKTYREQVANLQATTKTALSADDKTKLLNSLVLNELITQDADKKGVKATDEEVLAQLRSSNPGATDAQIKQAVEEQSNVTWDKAVVALRKQVVFIKYLSAAAKDRSSPRLELGPTEISDFYNWNQVLFASPDYVRVSQIFFDTKTSPKGTLADIKKRAEDTLAKINSGQATFEELANTISEDEESSKLNGDMGYLPRNFDNDIIRRVVAKFGSEFVTDIFALKKGELSKVMTSSSGLHIVRVTQKIEHHFLGLDEAVYPGKGSATVKDAITQTLQQRKVAAYQQQFLSDVGEDLKKQAKIEIFKQNL